MQASGANDRRLRTEVVFGSIEPNPFEYQRTTVSFVEHTDRDWSADTSVLLGEIQSDFRYVVYLGDYCLVAADFDVHQSSSWTCARSDVGIYPNLHLTVDESWTQCLRVLHGFLPGQLLQEYSYNDIILL